MPVGRARALVIAGLLLTAEAPHVGCDSHPDVTELCNRYCDRSVPLCAQDASADVLMQVQAGAYLCNRGCPSVASHAASCSISTAVAAAYQACSSRTTCAELLDCRFPLCPGDATGGTNLSAASGSGPGGIGGGP